MERVAGYIRVSSQEQKLHGYSLDAQRMKLQDYADAHGMEIVKIYADEGISGKRPIKKRPALQAMIEAAELAKISGELQRLNYSWQKGRIDPEVYDREYAALKRRQRTIESLDDAPDYARIEEILKKGWKEVYDELTDESKRAFWRSFVAEIRIKWDDEAKEVTDVIFL